MATLQVPISKAGKGVTLDFDKETFAEIQQQLNANPALLLDLIRRGFKDVLNSRMGKEIQAPSKLTGDEAEKNKAKALAQAQKNLEDFMSGKLLEKASKAKSDVPAKVLTIARQLAKERLKDVLRAKKIPQSHVAPKDMTALATQLVKEDPTYVEQAKARLAELEAVELPDAITSMIHIDPVRKAKADKDKAERKTQLSAKQAGITKSSKGKVPPAKGSRPPMTAQQAESFHQGHRPN